MHHAGSSARDDADVQETLAASRILAFEGRSAWLGDVELGEEASAVAKKAAKGKKKGR
jgi:hypothetical protein